MHVHVSAARADAVRWVDTRLLDLWSIALLQTVGTVSAVVSLAATRAGQYVALILGLVALVYTVCAAIWLVACAVGFAARVRRPAMRMVAPGHRHRLGRWLMIDAAIMVGSATCIFLVTALVLAPSGL